MKLFLSTIFSILFISTINAQQLPVFTQYRQYQAYINPAAFNSEYMTYGYNMAFGLSARSQWVATTGTPKTGVLFGEYIYDPNNGRFGIVSGINLVYDNTDPFSLTGLYGRLGAMLSNDMDYGALSIGMTVGVVQYRFQSTKLGDSPTVVSDPLAQENYARIFPDVGVGAFFMKEFSSGILNGDVMYAGFSVPQIFSINYKFEYELDGGIQQFGFDRVPHFYLTTGFYKYFDDSSFLELSSFVKSVAGRKTVHADFNIRGSFNDLFWIGTGVSTTGNFHFEAGFIIGEQFSLDNSIKIGYGYDHPFTTFGPRFGSTHEVNIAYAFSSK